MLHPTRIRGLKMKKLLTILLLAISMVGAFSSCQKECTCEPKEQSLILGKWNLESTTEDPNWNILSLNFSNGGIVEVKARHFETTYTEFRNYALGDNILTISRSDDFIAYKVLTLDKHLLEIQAIGYDGNGNNVSYIKYKFTKE